MTTPVYCILSGGAVHCIPVNAFNSAVPPKLSRKPTVAALLDGLGMASLLPAVLKIKNKNLLYTLNNPSLSDLESEANTGREVEHDEDDSDPLTPPRKERKGWPGTRNGEAENSGSHGPSGEAGNTVSTGNTVTGNTLGISGNTPGISGNTPGISTGNGISNDKENDDTTTTSTLHINIDDAPEEDILAILNGYSTHAVYLPQYSVDLQTNLDNDYDQIKTLLCKVFPAWTHHIHVKQLTGGITNMLLSCTHIPSEETLLIRVYGQGTNLIIDRHREFVSHLVLNSLKLAPSIHARFSNGLIYGFLPGRSLDPKELSNPGLFPLIAQQLGNWHNSINSEYIEDGVEMLRKYTAGLKKKAQPPHVAKPRREKKAKRLISNVWDLIEDWILIVPANEALVNNFAANLPGVEVTVENVRDVVQQEFKWMRTTLSRATKSSVVVSHCDLLSGNIIIPETEEFAERTKNAGVKLPLLHENPIQIIDYEYMLPAPRAFDIANHFAEWQGFDCDRSAIPEPSATNPVLVAWCKGYLNNENAPACEIEGLINEIACYYGMPGFYWGIWAMIQSELSTIDFNYAEYSELRLEEYWEWKKRFLQERSS